MGYKHLIPTGFKHDKNHQITIYRFFFVEKFYPTMFFITTVPLGTKCL